MASSKSPYDGALRELAALMVAVAGESVTMVKRSAPGQALKLKQKQEWTIYLEFLKVLFNLADRVSALHVPIQEQPSFMDGLEDAVAQHLKSVLEPALGPDTDMMEVVVTIGKAVAESRERYERFRFLVTEESQEREALFKTLGERVAQMLGASGNGMIVSAATLCASAAIPAMRVIFEGSPSPAGAAEASRPVSHGPTPPVTESAPPPAQADQKTTSGTTTRGIGNEMKLVSVISSVEGEEVETRWGLHPRFRQDLKPHEAQELSRLMNRVTRILGERYAAVAFSADWASWHQIGHA